MYKVLVVDDELLVRVGIKSLLDWESHGFQYAGDAPDGTKGLEEIESARPHIVLTDIVMPNMDGLTLIGKVKETYPSTRIIVLSSHNDYEYVRQAMKLGADDYILKTSMKPAELLQALQETAAKIGPEPGAGRDDPAERRRLREAAFRRACLAPAEEAASAAEEPAEPAAAPGPAGYLFLLLKVHGGSGNETEKRTLVNLVEQQVGKWTKADVFPVREDEIGIVAPAPGDGTFASGDGTSAPEEGTSASANGGAWTEMASDVLVAVKRFLDVPGGVGISLPFAAAGGLKEAYGQAKTAERQSFYTGSGHVHVYSPFRGSREVCGLFPKPQEERFVQCVELCDAEGMKRIMEREFAAMEEHRTPVDMNIRVFLEAVHCLNRELKAHGQELERWIASETPVYRQLLDLADIGMARAWFHRLIDAYCERMAKWRAEAYRNEIQLLLDYVVAHYTEEITMKSAARMVNMSEGYLGQLFKKQTGKSLSEYVTELRIEKAAELLRTTDLPAYAIAEQVGYDNFNYFGRLFKKVTGVNPTVYRDPFHKK